MNAIITYNNTKYELEIARTRLNMLMDKKESIYSKYFPITSQLKSDIVDGNKISDPMVAYIQELTRINKETGKSLETEIEEQREIITKLQGYLSIMNLSLINLTGIEADLYREIVQKGNKVTKAVNTIAEKYNKDNSTIWRIYHKKLKGEIQKLKKC